MKLRKTLTAMLAAAMCFTFAACSNGGTDSNSSVPGSSGGSTAPDSSSAGSSTPENSGGSSAGDGSSAPDSSSPDVSEPDYIRVAALKGPTAMGMTKMMNDEDESNFDVYDFEILASPDELTPKIVQGAVDIACVPANLGSVLYNKTEGGVKALAVNTLGVLYICENGDTVKSVEDLKGKTIFSSGMGATPEYALNFILKSNGLENDVTIEWKSEHTECLTSLLATENSVAMLPQPFVTTAQSKPEGANVRVALDLNDEWDKLGVDSSLLTGIVVVRKEFADKFPHAVSEFLSAYGKSVDFVNNNVDEAAELVGKYDIVPAAVAKKAIPNCHIVCITGEEMKTKLGGYLQVLFDNAPQSVGGKMPADDFYYNG